VPFKQLYNEYSFVNDNDYSFVRLWFYLCKVEDRDKRNTSVTLLHRHKGRTMNSKTGYCKPYGYSDSFGNFGKLASTNCSSMNIFFKTYRKTCIHDL
jgi:hypothetical protein